MREPGTGRRFQNPFSQIKRGTEGDYDSAFPVVLHRSGSGRINAAHP